MKQSLDVNMQATLHSVFVGESVLVRHSSSLLYILCTLDHMNHGYYGTLGVVYIFTKVYSIYHYKENYNIIYIWFPGQIKCLS